MHRVRVITIIAVVCVIFVGVFMLFKKMDQNNPAQNRYIDSNFDKKAIEQYWNDKDLFEKAKEYFISMPNDINIYRDNNSILAKDKLYEDVIIDEDFKSNLLILFKNFNSMNIIYYWADNKMIKFELTGVIQPKGIIYIEGTNEEEVKNEYVLVKCQFLQENWYYYEQPAGT